MTKREYRILRNVLLWSAALWAVIGVGIYRVVEPALHPTKEEAREQGEQIVAALEEYKATHGTYPTTLEKTGVPEPKTCVRYFPDHDAHRDRYSLVVYPAWGSDRWWYNSEKREWSLAIGSGG